MSSKRVVVTVAVAVGAFVSGGWFMQQTARPEGGTVYQQARLFDDVLAHVADFYVDSLSERQLYRMAIVGMLHELRDPYTGFLDGRELQRLSESTTGNYGGLGIQIDVRDGAIVVVAPLPDTPAERAGIVTGDRIVAVNDSSTARWTQEQAVGALRGPVGTEVRIRIDRPGVSAPLPFTLTRAEVHSRAVRLATMLDNNVGYVELFGFSQTTVRELQAAVDSLRTAGMRSLVLDLRYNPGGLLDEGIGVADLFLEPGQQIVATRGRAPGATRTFADRAPQRYAGLPLVVLVNGYSASASEIVAGALQDHDRALLVGTTSYGKGLVQSVYRLSEAASLKITTSKWYTPSGRSIQRPMRRGPDGVPAADTRDPDDELPAAARDSAEAARTWRTDAGRIVQGGGGITPDVVIRGDSALNAAFQRLRTALDTNYAKYTDAIAAFALNARARRTVSAPTFEVTTEIRGALLADLRQRGVVVDAATLAVAGRVIDQQLGAQTARFVFGRAGEVRRLSGGDDAVLAEAVRLAGRARTPQDLFTLAGQPAPSVRAGRP